MTTLVTVALFLVTAVCFKSTYSQLLISNTDPPTTDESPAIIAAPENATNVTVYCVVTRVGGSDPGIKQNVWRVTRPGDTMSTAILINPANLTGREGFENYFVTSNNITVFNTPIRTNLTIRVFDSSFDMANISCGSGNDVAINGTFILRVISECICNYNCTPNCVTSFSVKVTITNY